MPGGGEPTEAEDADRGQTNLDFVIGVSIFVVAVIVAITFVPDLVGGVAGTGQSDGVLADRVASDLANDELGHPARAGQLRLDCTVSLFSSMGYCGLGGSNLADNLEQASAVNVSLVHGVQACKNESSSTVIPASDSDCDVDDEDYVILNRNVRACYDEKTGQIVREDGNETRSDRCGDDADDVLLLGGPQPGGNADTSIARRSVRLDGQRLILEVRTW